MANRFLGEVSASAEGQTFTLRMDFNAMIEFEDATGKPAIDAFQEAEQAAAEGRVDFKLLRNIVFAALKRHHPDATIETAGTILSEDTQIVQSLLAAVAPEVKPGKARAGAKRPA
ncbi:hypothetical protein IB235_00105 [Paracoccus sp. PAR01]|nr:hypothetical protein [Paracoccus sp. PAR01]